MYNGLLISDFTIDNLAGLINNDDESPFIKAYTAPFDQVIAILLDDHHECWVKRYDFAVIWTRPERVSSRFYELMYNSLLDTDKIYVEVDEFCSAISNLTKKVKFAFVMSWVLPVYHRGLGMLEVKPRVGRTNILMHMNLRLFENISQLSNIYVLDTQRWIMLNGIKAFNPKLWYTAKIPFTNEIFIEAIRDLKASIQGILGQAKKLIIVDLDDTLWGGIVGDDGWENLRLGGHDYLGEAYVDFQRTLKALKNRGILLGIISKNEEKIALDAIQSHPEMILKLDDFVGWKINWNDKAQNIVELVHELNLGLQSVVFLDDNAIERARVRDALPEVLVPDLPQDKMLYSSTLSSLRCFDTPSLSTEDLARHHMYVSERKRDNLKKQIKSFDAWLQTLNIEVTIEKLSDSNIDRTIQLLNKTNQMNLSTRRLTKARLIEWEAKVNHKFWTIRVSDKFGDSGLTGIISIKIHDQIAEIIDFILSCRVMGRRIEETMLFIAYKYARSISVEKIIADFKQTQKNKPCFDFLKKSGFYHDEAKNQFIWDVGNEYPKPNFIKIIEN